jgi:hypothetical protein
MFDAQAGLTLVAFDLFLKGCGRAVEERYLLCALFPIALPSCLILHECAFADNLGHIDLINLHIVDSHATMLAATHLVNLLAALKHAVAQLKHFERRG